MEGLQLADSVLWVTIVPVLEDRLRQRRVEVVSVDAYEITG